VSVGLPVGLAVAALRLLASALRTWASSHSGISGAILAYAALGAAQLAACKLTSKVRSTNACVAERIQ
jgi:hypothetical protein